MKGLPSSDYWFSICTCTIPSLLTLVAIRIRPTYPLHYNVALDSGSEARYVHTIHTSLGSQSGNLTCPAACLHSFNEGEVTCTSSHLSSVPIEIPALAQAHRSSCCLFLGPSAFVPMDARSLIRGDSMLLISIHTCTTGTEVALEFGPNFSHLHDFI